MQIAEVISLAKYKKIAKPEKSYGLIEINLGNKGEETMLILQFGILPAQLV